MEYKDTEDTNQMRDNLIKINRNLNNHSVLLYVWDEDLKLINERMRNHPDSKKRGAIDFSNKRLRRVFNNGSFEQGGRFYGGWWANLPRDCRKYIRINGKDVVECDYSGYHINMGSITGLLMDSGFINEKSDRKAKKVLDIPIDHLYSIIK
ncbi:MAG: hypothetical protein JRH15_03750 [Deltaproteobacteria bacterium]|nr:hypothetical protein [Deltaproteobacteria bacterium]